ncbi:MAG TPA: transketolase [Candidatus Binatia bacterium]|nr:transketolase [Candidatus Binatia bacterium]
MARMQKITDTKQLKLIANTVRQDLIKSLVAAGSGHSGGPLGMADVFTALYFNVLNHDPANPGWEDRDRLILSNGHICPVQYSALANAGYFPREELKTLRQLGTRLQGHPHRGTLPGIETTSGPLASGLSQAAGMAYAARMDKKTWRVYCLMSDGELESGQIWEAALWAGKYRLHNLTGVIDRNNIQIDGHTEDVMPLEPLREKWEAFGWHVIDVDGHNHEHLVAAFKEAQAIYEKPTLIIAHTIPGRGVSYMENDHEWHGKPPTKEQGDVALAELEHWRSEIEQGAD